MFSFKAKFAAPALIAAALTLTGCFTSSDEKGDTLDFSPVLASVADDVIYPTYVDLSEKATALEAAVVLLSNQVTPQRLNAARVAWRAARAPWERSEGFLFGPVDTKSIDPSIDTWPLDSLTLGSILGDTTKTLNGNFVELQENNVRGYHAIEFLLFGTDSTKDEGDFTQREVQYLVAAAANFRARVDTLKNSWSPTGGNFLAEFKNAGAGSTSYRSKRAAAQELLEGVVGICDEVASAKISAPFGPPADPREEESRFSRNSTNDFANNIRSVRNIYLGTYSASGIVPLPKGSHLGHAKGIAAWVDSLNSPLAERVQAEIDSAISKIEQVGDFTAALTLTAGREKIAAAKAAVQTLHTSLDVDVRKTLFP
jgi:putative iron-regulated protein